MGIEEKISIHPPLYGEWKFLRPPGHHPFAFDFVQTDARRKKIYHASRLSFLLSEIPSSDYYGWGQPIYAPIEGEILHVGDGWEDHQNTSVWKMIQIWYNATYKFRPKVTNGRLDIRPNAGNHIMIKADDGYLVLLAHIRNKSITVKEGQRVAQGDLIGVVGNSGNSTAPHLHINLFDQMENPFEAKVLPFVFSSYETLGVNGQWQECTSSIPKAGDFVRFERITLHSRGTAQKPAAPLALH